MTKRERCGICGNRVGNRYCQALHGVICSSCCGTHRQGLIKCPASCPYLQAAERHLQARRAEELVQAWEDWQDRLVDAGQAHVLPYMEVLVYLLAQYLYRIPADDAEVRAAIEYLAQSLSPIELVCPSPPRLGEELTAGMLSLVERGKVDPELMRAAAAELATFMDHFSQADDPKKFVRALLGTHPKVEPSEPGLITPP